MHKPLGAEKDVWVKGDLGGTKNRKTHDRLLVAVDPGGVHVGVCIFGHNIKGWEPLWATEMTPTEFEDWYSAHCIHGEIDITVVEEWMLFPNTAGTQHGSDMPTSQLIGVIKYIFRNTLHIPMRDFGRTEEPQLVFQSTKIKKPTRSILKARNLASVAKVMKIPGDHALDAELHGYHYVIKTLGEDPHTTLVDRARKNRKPLISPYHWKDLSPWQTN